jgi:tetratricopeptide (TPR) repeat protein
MFDRSTITALATHAENEYAQVLEETGLLGLGLLIILGVIVWSSCVRNIRSTGQPIRSAAYGLCFGISAILIHSLSDFGQHLPANAILSAIFCALLLVLARSSQSRRRRAAPALTPSGNSTLLRTGVLLGGCILWAWTLIGADNARVARSHWEKAVAMEKGLADRNWQATEQEYAGLISFAAAASDREPENIEYRHWLNVYRWHSISPATDPDTGEFIISEDLMPTVRNIVDDFHKARVICPTYGPTYSIVGQIEKFVLNDNSGAERIRKGFRLAPCNPTACFVAGYLDVAEGKNEDCIEKLQKAMQLDRGLFGRVVNIYVNHLSRPHLAILAAGDDIGQLSHVVNVLEDMQYNDLAGQTREKIKDLLEAMCSQPDAPASALISLGNIYRKQQDSEAAIKCYRRALMLDYGQVYWRLELAELLAKTERIPEALREAQICRQLRPQLKTAENLVMKLSVNPAVFDKEN